MSRRSVRSLTCNRLINSGPVHTLRDWRRESKRSARDVVSPMLKMILEIPAIFWHEWQIGFRDPPEKEKR